jgi:cellulose 1,4-beta-cellobiosidase
MKSFLALLFLGSVAIAQNGHGVQLTWTQPAGTVIGNNVYRATSAAGPFTEIFQSCPSPCATPNAITTWLDQTGVVGTAYFYAVTAVNSAGQESPQDVDPNSVIYSLPTPAPTGLQLKLINGNQVQLNWTAAPRTLQTGIWRGDKPTLPAPSKLVVVASTETNYVDTPPFSKSPYYYEVRANYGTKAAPVWSVPSNIVGPVALDAQDLE